MHDTVKNLLKINDKLKNRVNVGLSMQSLNPITLTDIKMSNANIFDKDSVIVTVFCDHGSRYMSKIYSDEWMKNQGFSTKAKDEQESQIEFIR